MKLSFLPLLLLATAAHATTLTVTNTSDSGSGSLRSAVSRAKDGDTINFDPSLSGQTIALTSGEIAVTNSIDIENPQAPGLSVSGSDSSRIFNLGENLSVKVAGLTLTHGLALGGEKGGGAILVVASTLTLSNDVFSNNRALNGPSHGWTEGGAIAGFRATLIATDTRFISNQAVAPDGAGGAFGGAIANEKLCTTVLTRTQFISNLAKGGNGGSVISSYNNLNDLAAAGAIISGGASSLSIADSVFTGNRAIGGNRGSGGPGAPLYGAGFAWGGAIDNENDSTLVVTGSTFSYNQAIGGDGFMGGESGTGVVGDAWGGAIVNEGLGTVTNSVFDHNDALGGNGSSGGGGVLFFGHASGGAIASFPISPGIGALTANNDIFTNNRAVGGAGNVGGFFPGDGVGGAVAALLGGSASISDSSFSGNQATGGAGVSGGVGSDGLGGAVASWLGSAVTVNGSQTSSNQASGGSGTPNGNGLGGGLWNDGPSVWSFDAPEPSTLSILSGAVTGNNASTDGGGVFGSADGTACRKTANISGNNPDDVGGTVGVCP
jgi:hypothetical protein